MCAHVSVLRAASLSGPPAGCLHLYYFVLKSLNIQLQMSEEGRPLLWLRWESVLSGGKLHDATDITSIKVRVVIRRVAALLALWVG